MFTKEEMAGMSQAERDTARDMNAAEEAGQDVFGDGELPEPVETKAEVSEDAADETAKAHETADDSEAKPAEAEKLVDEAAAEATTPEVTEAEPAAAQPSKEPRQYEVADAAAIAEKRKSLRAEKATVESEWASGTLSDEAKAEKLAGIDDQLDTLLIEQTRAETLREANEQNRRQKEAEILDEIAAKAKSRDGVDYHEDADLGNLYDAKLRAVFKDEAFKGKSFTECATEAHARVLKAVGKAVGAPAPPPEPPAGAPAPAAPSIRAKPPAPPATLRELPAADKANVGDDIEAQWEAASGAKAEALWSRMSPAQQERMLAR